MNSKYRGADIATKKIRLLRFQASVRKQQANSPVWLLLCNNKHLHFFFYQPLVSSCFLSALVTKVP